MTSRGGHLVGPHGCTSRRGKAMAWTQRKYPAVVLLCLLAACGGRTPGDEGTDTDDAGVSTRDAGSDGGDAGTGSGDAGAGRDAGTGSSDAGTGSGDAGTGSSAMTF